MVWMNLFAWHEERCRCRKQVWTSSEGKEEVNELGEWD